MKPDRQIKTRAVPDCILCGNRGELLYKNLRDRLFRTPGRWDLKRCRNRQCRLIWPDPMPVEKEVGKLYENYYTHTGTADGTAKGNRGFVSLLTAGLNTVWNFLLIATPIYWERKHLFLMYLDNEIPGKLLEIGCGDGHRLAALRRLGWQTLGNEIDPVSSGIAIKNYNLEVKSEPLDEIGIAEETFDVIIMNHVVEHLYDPEQFLTICRKLLKTGGRLIIVTPNANSFGHKLFGRYWRGLEPPRHLHLFSGPGLLKLAEKAGFRQNAVRTSAANAQIFAAGSFDILQKGKHLKNDQTRLTTFIVAIFFQLLASAFSLLNRKTGEECILTAVKQ